MMKNRKNMKASNPTSVELFKNDPNSLIIDKSKSGEKSTETEGSTQNPSGYENTQYQTQNKG